MSNVMKKEEFEKAYRSYSPVYNIDYLFHILTGEEC